MSQERTAFECRNCGATVEADDDFCPSCGVSRVEARDGADRADDDPVDDASQDSFPASDPPAY